MSHLKLREENNCLNCGATVHGIYCSDCGQKNREPRISFFKLITHFISDIIHFDGKFFASLKTLFKKPGLLPKEFIVGKRVRYVDPIRMYIFTSAISFFIFFLFVQPDDTVKIDGSNTIFTQVQRDSILKKLESKLEKNPNSKSIQNQIKFLKDSTKQVTLKELKEISGKTKSLTFNIDNYESKKQYDSIQNTLPLSRKDGWFSRTIQYKQFDINEKYRNSDKSMMSTLSEIFLHKLPILLFISLPIFALILKLLYVRSKKYYYVDHSIFSIYHYIFSFFIFVLILLTGELRDYLNWSFFDYVRIVLVMYWVVYLYKSLRRFYNQGRSKTIMKLLLISFFGIITMLLLFVGFLFFSIFQL